MTHHPFLFQIERAASMYTIGQVAKKFLISRSTLIYYDSIGVLSPSGRSEANYRLYSDDDLKKMERITLFRNAGLPLDAIASLLNQEGDEINSALEQRLLAINNEIQALRNQQKVILNILQNSDLAKNARIMSKEIWVSLLAASGLDEAGMQKWHIEFEHMSPEAHQDFLESIGIEENEIASIREWSRNAK